MPTISLGAKELTFKIVYVGPAMSGKTTNVKVLYDQIPEEARGGMVSLDTEDERTLFFDAADVEIKGRGREGLKTRVQYYTVPGQIFYKGSRKVVLQGADAVVFVADSAPQRLDANARAWHEMQEHLYEQGLWRGREIIVPSGGEKVKKIEFEPKPTIPLVIQANKRDLEDAVDLELLKAVLDPEGLFPWIEAVAVEGKGVRETAKLITSLAIQTWQDQKGRQGRR